jgi:hypothetical protein
VGIGCVDGDGGECCRMVGGWRVRVTGGGMGLSCRENVRLDCEKELIDVEG